MYQSKKKIKPVILHEHIHSHLVARQHCQWVLLSQSWVRFVISACIRNNMGFQRWWKAFIFRFNRVYVKKNITEYHVILLMNWVFSVFCLQECLGCTSLRKNTLRQCILASQQAHRSSRFTPCQMLTLSGRISTFAGADACPTTPGST